MALRDENLERPDRTLDVGYGTWLDLGDHEVAIDQLYTRIGFTANVRVYKWGYSSHGVGLRGPADLCLLEFEGFEYLKTYRTLFPLPDFSKVKTLIIS